MSGGEKSIISNCLNVCYIKDEAYPFFCILDEIEAALDDANVYRYAEFLKEFSKNTQFIILPIEKELWKLVMFYMELQWKKGVSKVVSVDLTAN